MDSNRSHTGLNARDVNALTQTLLHVLQGEGQPLQSLLANTSTFTSGIGRQQRRHPTSDRQPEHRGGNAIQGWRQILRHDRSLAALRLRAAADRDPIGAAIHSLDNGTATLADLLTHARAPLAGTIDELSRLAPQLDLHKDHIDAGLQKEPDNLRKLVRLGAYGSFYNYYLCGVQIRVTDLQGATAVFPWIRQQTGRCADS